MLEYLKYVLLSLMGALGITECAILGVNHYKNSTHPDHKINLSQEERDNLYQRCWPLMKKHHIDKVDEIVKSLKECNRYSYEYAQEEKTIREKIDQADKEIRKKTNHCASALELRKLISDFEYKVLVVEK